jgi:SAM-dependent methyltransferase
MPGHQATTDPIAAFYDRHPYPPPVVALPVGRGGDATRAAHHLVWPDRPVADVRSVLVAGCGTSQAARHALRRPGASVVGIDVSPTSVDHTRRLATAHGLANLDVRLLAIEDVGALDRPFDHVVCTGVLHHLADPELGLRRLREVLAPGGAITLMVYGRHGRAGVALIQEYCRRLGVTPAPQDVAELVATLRELPVGHPMGRVLRESRDFLDDDALADALLNPREQSYTVPELLGLLDRAGLRFGRWERQAPYLPDCGSISETPHGARIATLPAAEQYAALELFRGTIARHTLVAFDATDHVSGHLDLHDPRATAWRPIRVPTAIAVEERLPPGAAAALLNRAHTDTDLVMFVDRAELAAFRRIDGRRTVAEVGADRDLLERFVRHDLVVVDTTETGDRR